jgi:hypothetical protein
MTLPQRDLVEPIVMVIIGIFTAWRGLKWLTTGNLPNDKVLVGRVVSNLNDINSLLCRPMQSHPTERQVRSIGLFALLAGVSVLSYGLLWLVGVVGQR